MVGRYIQVTGTGAFIAFILYLYLEIATTSAVGQAWKNIFLILFLVFSILAIVDALKGGLKDEMIIGSIALKKKAVKTVKK